MTLIFFVPFLLLYKHDALTCIVIVDWVNRAAKVGSTIKKVTGISLPTQQEAPQAQVSTATTIPAEGVRSNCFEYAEFSLKFSRWIFRN
jgi:hypothetical protein